MNASAGLRRLGKTGLDVHPLCLGGSTFGWTTDREASFAVLDAYVEAGGNFVDTADVYSAWVPANRGGESERVIGEWLASRGLQGRVIVATKVGSGAEELERGLTREHVIRGCEASLRRLGLDAIDLYYAHNDQETPELEETLAAFDELVRAGKVKHLGASNYRAGRLRQALEISAARGLASYEALQPRLNLVDRDDFEEELRRLCSERDLGVAVYSGLASGFLSGKYRRGGPQPGSARAAGVETRYLSEARALAALEAADAVGARHGVPVVQVALAWALAEPAVASVIASATTVDQLAELVEAVTLTLDPDDLAGLDEASRA
jgi:aryl-alcohol dehydrogenase (NADP+)